MRHRGLRTTPLTFFLALLVPVAYAGEDAHSWLMRIHQAAHDLNYQGTFVYQHGDQLESLRILRKVQNGLVRERLVSLNGAAREVIRTDREVRCYLPDESSVVVEHRQTDARGFPSLLPQSARDLDRNYVISLGRAGRVVDRKAQQVIVAPRDGYRYGYQLWADQETGLLLKAALVDDKGNMIEQFMFNSVEIGGTIPDAAFEPRDSGKEYAWYREEPESGAATASTAAKQWTVNHLPPGFTLSKHITRFVPAHKKTVEHMVYSDGLAVVSVFVAKRSSDAGADVEEDDASSSVHIGAVHARGRIVDDHRITVVGEVPAVTVDMIGGSVARLP